MNDRDYVHFVGIGGSGMSALARILLARGARVSGSDVRATPLIERLRAEGARIAVGHRAENIGDATLVVASAAIAPDNPELVAARARKTRVLGRGEMLAEVTVGCKTIAVAGTHGKTTTTAMIAAILEDADLDPSVMIGGVRIDDETNARLGRGPWFVTESDESDGSFLHLRPTIAVVTNIENDHVGSDDAMANLIAQFETFVSRVPPDGVAIVGIDSTPCARIARGARWGVTTFGLADGATVRGRDLRFTGLGSTFDVEIGGEQIGSFCLQVPGEMNVQNALAAIAAARAVDVDVATIVETLGKFSGVHRRFEILARGEQMIVVDDYAHHPTAVAATIAAARRYHDGPIVVAFQPHRYTRTAYLAANFGEALAAADEVYLAPIYAASEEPIDDVSERSIGAVLERHLTPVRYVGSVEALGDELRGNVKPGSLVLMLGAGSITNVAHALAKSIAAPALAG
ncbi:MAG TPA: UDP-N-acetylmuramate--L-alanine ligase [Candidatus Binatia bacterium]|nr:UDP-N-acetylmuramate--L-alanine ligase [Candidatus Binatia bacterium]